MPHTPTTDLLDRARAWLAEDPDPQTRKELAALLADAEDPAVESAASAWAELADRFSGRLEFGTAGLRGALGAGPMRMNRTVVIRAAAGLAGYLRKQALTDTTRKQALADTTREPALADTMGGSRAGSLVVIGYDARHRSYDFAHDTAAVLTGAGLRAALLPGPLPTPVLAFAVRHLGAVAGVMVTASHNPPKDNGYKIYLGDGAQIVPPADAGISAEIDAIGSITGLPLADGGWEVLGDEVVEAYLDRAVSLLDPAGPRELDLVYTPLHGVGRDVLLAAFERAGFAAPTVVAEQAEPDPDFPTVPFPNPEEPGAMDLAFRTAAATGPDLVLANDPDADRCAVAVPDGAPGGALSAFDQGGGRRPPGWRMLRGDEVGALLAEALVAKHAEGTFATTIVSSSLLGRIAAAAGLDYAETLTGFKWISRADGLRYGYEEALGYCVDPAGVRDKDGITAALLVAELAAALRQSGRTLADMLDDLALEHGLHATDQLSVRVADLTVIAEAMRRLRERPPVLLAGLQVVRTDDLSAGSEQVPPTDGLRYHLDGKGVRTARIVVRPSGTEPKLKCYLEVVLPVDSAAELAGVRERAGALLDALKRELAAAAGI